MTVLDWAVLGGGVGAILWVNWYFFRAPRRAAVAAAIDQTGRQEITVTVKGGYDPAIVRVHHGVPVRLIFDRQEASSCSDEIVLGEFGLRRSLPAFQKTAVDFTPLRPGTYGFTCGMGMMHGEVVVD
jgi:plastocyanin domain-containing protein